MDAQLMRARARMIGVTVIVAWAGAGEVAAETRPAYGGTVVASLLSEPVSFDPIEAQSHAEVTVCALIFATLYRADGRGGVAAHLAAALPIVADDGLEVTITLRRELRFHDGTELGADDVVRSLDRLRQSQAGWLLAPVREIVAVDANVVLRLRHREVDVARLLTAIAASITPDGVAPGSANPIGSGPFRFRSINREQRLLALQAAPEHVAGRPYADGLDLRWYDTADAEARSYESGRAHLSLRGAVAFSGHQPKYRTDDVEGPATLLVYVGFGRDHPAVAASRDFRHALSLAVGRASFRAIGSGERVVPTVHAAPLDAGGAATEAGDLRSKHGAAVQALERAAAGVAELRSGVRAALRLRVIIDRTRPDDREVAEKIVAALYHIGLAAHIAELGPAEYARRVRGGHCDLYIGQLATMSPGAELATLQAFAAGDDSWAARQLAAGPVSWASARQALARRVPLVPLFHRAVRVHHRHELRGVGLDVGAVPSFADIFRFGQATPVGADR